MIQLIGEDAVQEILRQEAINEYFHLLERLELGYKDNYYSLLLKIHNINAKIFKIC